jgi:hypothetical protein
MGRRALSEPKTELQWPTDAPAPHDLSPVDGNGAPDDLAPPAPPEPPLAEAPSWHDIPVASILPPFAPLVPPTLSPSPLEDRLHRLEEELARLRAAPSAAPAPHPDPATSVVSKPGGFWSGFGKRLVAPSGPAAAAPTAPPPSPRSENLASMIPAGVRRTWRLFDALTELRAMYWMYFDPRYRLSWMGRLGPLIIAALIVTSGFWMPGTALPLIGLVIDKLVDLILAYILFKLLSSEARRYRETAPDLPPSLRL